MPGHDPEMQLRWNPEAPTEREKLAMKDIDPVTLEIYGHRLFLIVWEGRQTVMKMGVTAGLTAGDLNTGIYTIQGDLAVSSTGVHYHTPSPVIMIKYLLKHFGDDPSVGVKEGDIFFCNNPRIGAVHTPDNYLITPVFYRGELIAFACAGAHEADVGCTAPGVNPYATSRFEEGITFAPARIARNFELMNDIMNVIAMSTRDDRSITLDTKAKITALMRMRQRVLEIAEQKGPEFVIGLLAKLIEVGEEQFRLRLSRYNDGTFRHVSFYDSTGGEDTIRAIVLTMTKRGDELTLDLTGSSPPAFTGCANAVPTLIAGALAVRVFNYIGHDLRGSGGFLRRVKCIVPEGSMFSSPQDAPVNGGVSPSFLLEQGIQSCFNKMVFDSEDRDTVAAISSAGQVGLGMAGISHRGLSFTHMLPEVNATGGGASYARGDGLDVYGPVFEAVIDGLDLEWVESHAPMLYLFRKHSMDTAGMGKYRGGCGMDLQVVIYKTPFCVVGGGGPGSKFVQGSGCFGGYAPTVIPGMVVKGGDTVDRMQRGEDIPRSTQEVMQKKSGKGEVVISNKMMGIWAPQEGDELNYMQVAGAGYGDVLERDPDAVLKDLQAGIISRWVAENVCHVAIDLEAQTVNHQKTRELRSRERKNRKQRGRKYEDFIKEWAEKRPPPEAIMLIGQWPHGDD